MLEDEHRVAVAEEAIVFGDCLFVRALEERVPAKGAHENNERRFWKVEVRQHSVDGLELIRGANEKVRLSGKRLEFVVVQSGGIDRTVGVDVTRGFQRSDGGGADGDHASAASFSFF